MCGLLNPSAAAELLRVDREHVLRERIRTLEKQSESESFMPLLLQGEMIPDVPHGGESKYPG
jgi:hypothetical protein